MKNKHSWKELIGEPQLCEGGRLISIVFCCDSRKKKCPILEEALKSLGLTEEDFIKVMEKHSIPIKEIDGTGFGDLAFCPSMEKESKDRDTFLLENNWGIVKYLKYKFKILEDLIPEDKWDYAFETRIMKQYAIEALELDTQRVYKALAMGNINGTLIVTEIIKDSDLSDVELRSTIAKTEYVGVRIPKDLVSQLDELVEKGIVGSRSDGIRRALILYLSAISSGVKQGMLVKREKSQ